jgi:hypothetical protein
MATKTVTISPPRAERDRGGATRRIQSAVADRGLTIALALIAVVASTGLATVGAGLSRFTLIALIVVVALAGWCLQTRHTDRALIVVGLYLLLADGYVKLKINSTSATLLRDVLLFAVVANMVVRRRRAVPGGWPPMTAWVLAFVAAVLVQTLNPGTGSITQAAAGLRLHLEFVPLFLVGALWVQTEERIRGVLWLLVAAGVANSIATFVQFNLTPSEFAAWGPGYRERVLGVGDFANAGRTSSAAGGIVRPFGLGSDLGFGGLVAALGLPACLALAMRSARPLRGAGLTVCALILVIGVVTTQSRVAVICAVAGLFAFLAVTSLSRRAARLIAVAVVLVAAALVLLPLALKDANSGQFDRLQTIRPDRLVATTRENRGRSIDEIGRYVADYPVGAGVGRSGPAAGLNPSLERLNSETQFTFMLVETGLPGLIPLMALSLFGLWGILATRRISDSGGRTELAALASPLAGIAVMWIAATTTAGVPTSPFFWLVSGVVAGKLGRRHGGVSRPLRM